MLEPNSLIGRYEIQRRVGQGGMGTLYLAHDPVLGRAVALKLFLGDLEVPEARNRFVREARAAAGLSHPNIVTVYDYGEFSSQPYMVLEFIDGQTLASLIQRRIEIPILTRLRWMEELAAGVEYAHARGVIHRDIKPLNLMIDTHARLKILDFGIARMRGSLASTGTASIGTAGYTAPEQLNGGSIDPRSDLFSIGVVCYELLAGVSPFAAELEPAVTKRVLSDDPLPLPQVIPTIDPELAGIVWKALRKDPVERFQDSESMRAAFEAVRRRLEALTTDTGVVRFRLPRSGDPGPDVAAPTPRRRLHDEERATPGIPSDRRAEREALVKKRLAEIQEGLRLAREHLATHNLPAARAECERVLLVDKSHPVALDLLHRINLESGRGQVETLLAEGHRELGRGAITKANELLQKAQAASPNHPEAVSLERALRLARASQDVVRRRTEQLVEVIAAADEAMDRGDVDAALRHARSALELDPASSRARALEAEARRSIEQRQAHGVAAPHAETQLVQPKPRPPGPRERRAAAAAPKAASRWQTTARAYFDRLRATSLDLGRKWRQIPARQRAYAAGGLATVAVVLAAIAFWPRKGEAPAPPPPPPIASVPVVIDATPWATIKEIKRRDNGAVVAIAGTSTTPISLMLTPGVYDVTLEGPSPAFMQQPLTIEVLPDQPARPPAVRFDPMTVERYFQEALMPKAPGTGGGGE